MTCGCKGKKGNGTAEQKSRITPPPIRTPDRSKSGEKK